MKVAQYLTDARILYWTVLYVQWWLYCKWDQHVQDFSSSDGDENLKHPKKVCEMPEVTITVSKDKKPRLKTRILPIFINYETDFLSLSLFSTHSLSISLNLPMSLSIFFSIKHSLPSCLPLSLCCCCFSSICLLLMHKLFNWLSVRLPATRTLLHTDVMYEFNSLSSITPSISASFCQQKLFRRNCLKHAFDFDSKKNKKIFQIEKLLKLNFDKIENKLLLTKTSWKIIKII